MREGEGKNAREREGERKREREREGERERGRERERGEREREKERERERGRREERTKTKKERSQAGRAPFAGVPSPTQNGLDDGLSPGTGDKLPTTPASRAPRPDVMVGLWDRDAAHMPDVSEHPGGPSLSGDRRPRPPVG